MLQILNEERNICYVLQERVLLPKRDSQSRTRTLTHGTVRSGTKYA